MDRKTENEKKKEYLREYNYHVRRIRRIETEFAELRLMKISGSGNMDGMPHGSNQSDLSDYVAELDSLERKLVEERYRRVLAYKEIVRRIKSLESENEKDVLFYRYIAGYDWPEIARKLRYSERQVHRFHGKALEHFRLPEEKSVEK